MTTIIQRAALYLRVSTARQAEHAVSLPDQQRQGEAYCEARGYQLVETFIEPGATATNDRRPEFQRMIEAGTSKPAPFDVVVVHSFSRFFRDHFELEFYIRKLAKNGVRLVSITQEMGDDPMHNMMRQIMALFDEYQSKETAKHVLRAMRENARQGFWNGSLPPIGYRTVVAEQRGAKAKKKIEIDPLHADTVRRIFSLASQGDGTNGPMGVKAIATWLNANGITTRDGGRWGVGAVHQILTRSTYTGRHEFNRTGKGRKRNPASEIVVVDVPALIDQAIFDAVQARMKARNPRVAPPQVVGGPTLLTGLIHCAKCGGAMTIRTGKGGRYRYYTCSTKARQGVTGCTGMTVPMEKLDDLVAGHLEDRLLQPQRLETILTSVLDRREERTTRKRAHIAELNKRATEADQRLKRLFDAIESGIADLDDADLKDRIATLKATRDQARVDAERAIASLDSSGRKSITPDMLASFASTARQRIRIEGGGYRRDHLRALAQHVEVDEGEVRIIGSKSRLFEVLAGKPGPGTKLGPVPSFVPKWCTRQDSNLWPQD
ncbi:recombinase family protein [Sphingobium cloacae]|uniref:Resolvase domain-containing protein n=1 Tax=Sphingobium cloacae TaxID=120107 RepID=A0A1E1F1T1_9SPHN|nr:recombinase family protein [Sphingobium cloacae]BAV64477.1 resolvase domain-containing protein [Sphingobium cloacae]